MRKQRGEPLVQARLEQAQTHRVRGRKQTASSTYVQLEIEQGIVVNFTDMHNSERALLSRIPQNVLTL